MNDSPIAHPHTTVFIKWVRILTKTFDETLNLRSSVSVDCFTLYFLKLIKIKTKIFIESSNFKWKLWQFNWFIRDNSTTMWKELSFQSWWFGGLNINFSKVRLITTHSDILTFSGHQLTSLGLKGLKSWLHEISFFFFETAKMQWSIYLFFSFFWPQNKVLEYFFKLQTIFFVFIFCTTINTVLILDKLKNQSKKQSRRKIFISLKRRCWNICKPVKKFKTLTF